MKIVAYQRVSTARQGASGLGLEAQAKAIADYVASRGATVVGTFTEVESGKDNGRPELRKALDLALLTGATLVIAKLDRLSRNAAFLLALRDSGTVFVAADLPDANHLTVGIMAVVAEEERKMISRRTKEALATARAKGVKLGNPHGAAYLHRAGKGNVAAIKAVKDSAARHAEKLKPIINALKAEGIVSLGAVADALNDRGILTPRGGAWHRSSVRNLLARC